MTNSFVKIIKKSVLNKKVQNIGYLPRWIIFVIDVAIVAVASLINYIIIKSLAVDFDGYFFTYIYRALFIIIVNAAFFIFFKTYAGIIRHSTFIDGVKLLISTTCAYVFLLITNILIGYIFNVKIFLSTGLFITYVISFLLLFLFRILVKDIFEKYTQVGNGNKLIKAVIFGADANAISVANALKTEKPSRFKLIAFIDKYKESNTSKSILNLPILAQKKSVYVIMRSVGAEALILAEKGLTKEETIAIVEECLEYNFKVFTVPLITDWKDQKQISNQLKNFDIEDLLERSPIILDSEKISSQLYKKTVLITGGAGSIGSEIVRQIVRYDPQQIIILDQAESPLHSLQLEISDLNLSIDIISALVDVRNKNDLEKIFKTYKPNYVYHAAAYKHVPLMEENPCQAIYTNVIGTKNLADLASKYEVEKFVFISTDKAVNPSSVMGASKRIAEKYVQSFNFHLATKTNNSTKFITTRFGNVLGSNGSIVPLFTKQINEGGPITITHPEIIRYFMTIPEACQLVLEAGAMGNGGEIFIFDMGKPVKIIDLARKMIGLAGFTPDKEIKIKIIGLRPGEKLFEELLNDESKTLPTHNEKILIAQDTFEAFEQINILINELISISTITDNDEIVSLMKKIVPEFKSMNSIFQTLDS
jgi:FlaA1/EpsC-like NDP-sugar epimerase